MFEDTKPEMLNSLKGYLRKHVSRFGVFPKSAVCLCNGQRREIPEGRYRFLLGDLQLQRLAAEAKPWKAHCF